MDSNLNAHITALYKACHFHLRSLRHIKRSHTDDMAILIAVASVQSHLDYCNLCHVSISISSSKIFLPGLLWMIAAHPSNRFLLTIFKPELNLECALLHISYFLKTNLLTPSLITSYVLPRLQRSSDQCLLTQPQTRTCTGQRAFRVCAPTLWNSPPLSIRLSPYLATFKHNLKTFYFAPSKSLATFRASD